MKRFFLKIFIFVIVFVIIDQLVGLCSSTLIAHAKGGDTGKNNIIVDSITADVVLFGSSRCNHHYDPRIIQDSLYMTCYNAGRDGNGILMMYPYYELLSQRYQPKVIIYDLSSFDYVTDDHAKYMEWLRQFKGRPAIDSMIYDINPQERYKMMCCAYRINGKGLQLISDAIHPIQQDIMGYKPLDGTISYTPEKETESDNSAKHIDVFKEKYIIRLINDCKRHGTKLFFVVSPTYGQKKYSPYYKALTNLCKQYNVPLFYHENDKNFISNGQLFKDHAHLNHIGAEKFTRMIIKEVRPYLK